MKTPWVTVTHSDGSRFSASLSVHRDYERMLSRERSVTNRGHRADRRPVDRPVWRWHEEPE